MRQHLVTASSTGIACEQLLNCSDVGKGRQEAQKSMALKWLQGESGKGILDSFDAVGLFKLTTDYR